MKNFEDMSVFILFTFLFCVHEEDIIRQFKKYMIIRINNKLNFPNAIILSKINDHDPKIKNIMVPRTEPT